MKSNPAQRNILGEGFGLTHNVQCPIILNSDWRVAMDSVNLSNAFGDEVRALRIAKGISLRELAEKAGFSKTYLSYIERGVHPPPSADKVVKLADALGESKDRLLKIAGLIDPKVDLWLKYSQEYISPAVRSAASESDKTPDSSAIIKVILLAILIYAISKSGGFLDGNDDAEEQNIDLSKIKPEEFLEQIEESFIDTDHANKVSLAALLRDAGSMWLNKLDSMKPSNDEEKD